MLSFDSVLASSKDSEIKKYVENCNIHQTNEQGQTILHAAALNNKTALVKLLIKKGASVNVADNRGWTPLHNAALNGNFKLCDILLSKKVKTEVNVLTSGSKVTPLSLLVRNQCFDMPQLLKTLQLFTAAGADMNLSDKDLNTALHYACDKGTSEAIEFLLNNKADPNLQNSNGDTPLHAAVLNGRSDVVTLLLSNPNCLITPNCDSVTPIDIAKEKDFKSLHSILTERANSAIKPIKCSAVTTQAPQPRFHHSATTYQNKIYIVGGCDNPEVEKAKIFYETIQIFDTEKLTWNEVRCQSENKKLVGHSASIIGHLLYISGGRNQNKEFSKDLWALDIVEFKWKPLVTIPYQIPITYPFSVPVSRLNIFFLASADNAKAKFDDLLLFDIFTLEWKSNFKLEISPDYRENYTLTRVWNSVYLFGGKRGDALYGDLWCLDLKEYSWKRIIAPGHVPSSRYNHSAAHFQDTFFVCGGIGKNGEQLNDLLGLNTKTMIWSKYQINPAPESPTFSRIGFYSVIQNRNHQLFLIGGSTLNEVFKIELPQTSASDSLPECSENSEVDIRHHSATDAPTKFATSAPQDLFTVKRQSTMGSVHPTATASGPMELLAPSPFGMRGSHIAGGSTIRECKDEEPERKTRVNKDFLMKHIEILDDFSGNLNSDSLHFISLLQKTMEDVSKNKHTENPENHEEMILLLKNMCEELEIYCTTNRPPSYSKKNNLGNSKIIQVNRFSPEKFPFNYYQALEIPESHNPPLPSDFEKWSKEHKARYMIGNEILQTESVYARDLAVLIGYYMKPLQNEYKDLVNQFDFNSLFKNIEILFDVSKVLLKNLKEELKNPLEQQDIGKYFIDFEEDLRKYIVFSANQLTATETLIRLQANQSCDFVAFCELVKTFPECNRLALRDYLIKPFQRICRYPLLLKELGKQTPKGWASHTTIEKAIKVIDVIVTQANDSKRQSDDLAEIIELQNKFIINPGDTEIMQLHKLHFIRDGVLKYFVDKKKLKPVHLLLFNEKLILATPKGKKLIKLLSIAASNIIIYDTVDSKNAKNSFSIIDISDKKTKIDIAAPTPQEKQDWVNAINEAGNHS